MMEDRKILKNEQKTGKVFFRFLKQNPFAMIGSAVIVISVLTSVFVPLLPIPDPLAQDLPNRFKPPSTETPIWHRQLWAGRTEQSYLGRKDFYIRRDIFRGPSFHNRCDCRPHFRIFWEILRCCDHEGH